MVSVLQEVVGVLIEISVLLPLWVILLPNQAGAR